MITLTLMRIFAMRQKCSGFFERKTGLFHSVCNLIRMSHFENGEFSPQNSKLVMFYFGAKIQMRHF